jgi:hypothetical protein
MPSQRHIDLGKVGLENHVNKFSRQQTHVLSNSSGKKSRRLTAISVQKISAGFAGVSAGAAPGAENTSPVNNQDLVSLKSGFTSSAKVGGAGSSSGGHQVIRRQQTLFSHHLIGSQ